jgi:predicted transposase/invertase (TIGR01784 family)
MSEVGKDDAKVDEDLLGDPVIGRALRIVEVAALSPVQLALYNQELDKIRMDGLYAFDAKQEGRAEGRAEGKAELIKTMHANGMDVAQISLVTGYSVDQVQACL